MALRSPKVVLFFHKNPLKIMNYVLSTHKLLQSKGYVMLSYNNYIFLFVMLQVCHRSGKPGKL